MAVCGPMAEGANRKPSSLLSKTAAALACGSCMLLQLLLLHSYMPSAAAAAAQSPGAEPHASGMPPLLLLARLLLVMVHFADGRRMDYAAAGPARLTRGGIISFNGCSRVSSVEGEMSLKDYDELAI